MLNNNNPPVDITKVYNQVVPKYLTDNGINALWNSKNVGNQAKLSTTQRWCRNGAITKNPNFNPWLLSLAQTLCGAEYVDAAQVNEDVFRKAVELYTSEYTLSSIARQWHRRLKLDDTNWNKPITEFKIETMLSQQAYSNPMFARWIINMAQMLTDELDTINAQDVNRETALCT